MSRESQPTTTVSAFRSGVSESIKQLPLNPPDNPYRQQIGVTVRGMQGPTTRNGEGRVDFHPPYQSRRVWLPGLEVVLAHHPRKQHADVIINRFRHADGHGLVARAWYTDNTETVQRTYSEGPWHESNHPEVASDVRLDSVLALSGLIGRLAHPDEGLRRDLLDLAQPLDDVEMLSLESARTELAEQARFSRSLEERGGFHHTPLYEGESPERLAGIHTLAVPYYDPNQDDPQIRY